MTQDNSIATFVLKTTLDRHVRGELDAVALGATLTVQCREHPDANWEALALLDQYYRRGAINTDAFATAKSCVLQQVFGKSSNSSSESNSDAAAVTAIAEPNPASTVDSFSDSQTADIPTQQSSTASLIGAVIHNRYVLVSRTASSAAAETYKAFDRQRAGLPESETFVTIKYRHAADEKSARSGAGALQNEFACARHLSHPNIVSTYDYLGDTNGEAIVTEWVPGQLLSYVIDRCGPQSMDTSQALVIIREIGLALIYAHQQGTIHGALDASQVIVMPNGEIRVFGFGASKPSLSKATQLRTRDDSTKDARDDVLALASIAYQLLSGCTPLELEQQQRHPARIKQLERSAWHALEHGLAIDREHRPTDLREWLLALDPYGAARQLTPLAQLRPAASIKDKSALGTARLAAALVGVVVVGLAAWFFISRPSSESQQPLVESLKLDPMRVPRIDSQLDPAVDVTALDHSRSTSEAATSVASLLPTTLAPTETHPATLNSPSTTPAPVQVANVDALPVVPTAIPVSSEVKESVTQDRPVNVTFLTNQSTVVAGEPAAKFVLRRSGSLRRELPLNWRTIAGSAKPDRDFVPVPNGVAVFAPGARTATLVVPIVQHAERRHTEWFDVELIASANVTLGEIPRASVIIVPAE